MFGGGVWLGTTFAFAAFMLTPALEAAPILGLPRAELLPLGGPARGTWR